MSRQESPEARAERILAELREATREAAGVLKDLAAAQKSAREQIDDYLHDEVERVLAKYTTTWQEGADQFHAEMKADIAEHITGYTAVVKNEISRTAIFKEAVTQILAELHQISANAGSQFTASGIPVTVTWDLEARNR